MPQPIAYASGEFVPAAELSVAPQDAGFMLGITVAEQLRTFRGELFAWEEHCSRLARGLSVVGLLDQVDLAGLQAAAEHVTRHNHALLDEGDDLGVTVFVTPGMYGTYRPHGSPSATIGIHSYPLPFSLWAEKYETGQHCVVSSVRQVSEQSWPRDLKCRSRAHYYLANRQVQKLDPAACAILLDQQDNVNETPTANVLAYYAGEGIVSPPLNDILPGISLGFVQRLAADSGIAFTYRRLPVDELRAADEIMLTSTPYCVMPVSALDGKPFYREANSPRVASQLLTAWSSEVGLDIAAQAKQFATRRVA